MGIRDVMQGSRARAEALSSLRSLRSLPSLFQQKWWGKVTRVRESIVSYSVSVVLSIISLLHQRFLGDSTVGISQGFLMYIMVIAHACNSTSQHRTAQHSTAQMVVVRH